MNTDLLARIDPEQIYRHLLHLEGVRHPIDAPAALDIAADYIHTQLLSYGVRVAEQPFSVEGFDGVFRNIEGALGDENQPAIVLVCHYDTVWNDPGINDNGSGVAAILEVARVLAALPSPPAVYFLFASLEEGNPAVEQQIRVLSQRHGVTDARHRYTTHALAAWLAQHTAHYLQLRAVGAPRADAFAQATRQIGDIPENLRAYLDAVHAIYARKDDADQVGWLNKIGSSAWVEAALARQAPIRFALCLDELGTVKQAPHTQTLPPGITYDMMTTYKVHPDRASGDWMLAIGHDISKPALEAFWAACSHPRVDLPCATIHLPLDFAGISQHVAQALGSDHAPFWRAHIPALLIFDTADWRNPFCHSPADTIDKVDIEQLVKVCKAVMVMILEQEPS